MGGMTDHDGTGNFAALKLMDGQGIGQVYVAYVNSLDDSFFLAALELHDERIDFPDDAQGAVHDVKVIIVAGLDDLVAGVKTSGDILVTGDDVFLDAAAHLVEVSRF